MNKSMRLLVIIGFSLSMVIQARFVSEQDEQLKRKEKMSSIQAKEAEAKAKRDQKIARTNADVRYKKAKIEAEHDKDIAQLEHSRNVQAEKMRNVYYPADYAAINNAMQTSDTRFFR